jgi:hypothetical protein
MRHFKLKDSIRALDELQLFVAKPAGRDRRWRQRRFCPLRRSCAGIVARY